MTPYGVAFNVRMHPTLRAALKRIAREQQASRGGQVNVNRVINQALEGFASSELTDAERREIQAFIDKL